MRAPKELWEQWEGRLIDGRFPLRQWLGGSEHSTVFLTERGNEPRKAAIKLIASEELDEASRLSRWVETAKLSHLHLIRLFECGRCQIDGTRFLYVVMEHAEEDLGQILPVRALSPGEVGEMLQPAAKALAFLHQTGFAHAHIQPSNIMAVDNQLKLSADGLLKDGEHDRADGTNRYTAPEVAAIGVSPAADVWSLGITLVDVLIQHGPQLQNEDRMQIVVPETIPEPFREITRQCLRFDPRQRCTVADILDTFQVGQSPGARPVEQGSPEKHSKRRIILPVAAAVLFLGALVGGTFIVRRPRVPLAGTRPAESPTAPAAVSGAQSQAPIAEKTDIAPTGSMRGSVLRQVLPEVSGNAQRTITGRVKVSVRVAADASGNVVQASLASTVTSKYFANLALAAARRWKFNPPQANRQPTSSDWLLRFQFGRTSTKVFASQINP